MGNVSYFLNQEGCEIDVEKLNELCKERGIDEAYHPGEPTAGMKPGELGRHLHGWKIQGYWYKPFVKFLFACADAMTGLTGDRNDNCIEMEEKRGFVFRIFFYHKAGENKIAVDAVPMRFESFVLSRDGEIRAA